MKKSLFIVLLVGFWSCKKESIENSPDTSVPTTTMR